MLDTVKDEQWKENKVCPDSFQPKDMFEPALIFKEDIKNREKNEKSKYGIDKKKRSPGPAKREKQVMQKLVHRMNSENTQ